MFDNAARAYFLEFEYDKDLMHLPTEIYIPVFAHYKHGYRIITTDGWYWPYISKKHNFIEDVATCLPPAYPDSKHNYFLFC